MGTEQSKKITSMASQNSYTFLYTLRIPEIVSVHNEHRTVIFQTVKTTALLLPAPVLASLGTTQFSPPRWSQVHLHTLKPTELTVSLTIPKEVGINGFTKQGEEAGKIVLEPGRKYESARASAKVLAS